MEVVKEVGEVKTLKKYIICKKKNIYIYNKQPKKLSKTWSYEQCCKVINWLSLKS